MDIEKDVSTEMEELSNDRQGGTDSRVEESAPTEDPFTEEESNRKGLEQSVIHDLRSHSLIHGTIDFKQEGMLLGFKILIEGPEGPEETSVYVINDGDGIRMNSGVSGVVLGQTKYYLDRSAYLTSLDDRWSIDLLRDFVGQPEYPDDLFSLLKSSFAKYLDFQSDAHLGLLASWSIGTYFSPLFPVFSFLFLYGPKETGKSKVLEALQLTSFNAVKVKSISEPALGDIMSGQRATLLIDQAESLPKHLVGILADSYKKAGAKRQIVTFLDGERRPREFSLYGPKSFASSKQLDPDLRDRCIQVGMLRTIKPLPDLMGWEPEWLQIRDACYRFLLLRWQEVANAFMEIPSRGTRQGELWRPLGAILRVLDVPKEDAESIQDAFEEGTARTRSELSDREAAVFQVILEQALADEKTRFEMPAQDILEAVKVLLGKKESISPQWIGTMISQFCLADDVKKRTRRKLTYYVFTRARVMDIATRYLPDDPCRSSDIPGKNAQPAPSGEEPSLGEASGHENEEPDRRSEPEREALPQSLENEGVANSSEESGSAGITFQN